MSQETKDNLILAWFGLGLLVLASVLLSWILWGVSQERDSFQGRQAIIDVEPHGPWTCTMPKGSELSDCMQYTRSR